MANDYSKQIWQIRIVRIYWGDQSHLNFVASLESFLNERGYLTEKQITGLDRMARGLEASYQRHIEDWR